MPTVDGHRLGAHSALELLATATHPVRIRAAHHLWPIRMESLAAFLADHGRTRVGIATGVTLAALGPRRALSGTWVRTRAGRVRLASAARPGDRPTELRLTIEVFLSAVRNGTLPCDTYCFHDLHAVSGLSRLSAEVRSLEDFFRTLTLRKQARTEALVCDDKLHKLTGRGSTRIALGAAGSGNTWHRHGDALNIVLAGSKQWWIHNTSTPIAMPIDDSHSTESHRHPNHMSNHRSNRPPSRGSDRDSTRSTPTVMHQPGESGGRRRWPARPWATNAMESTWSPTWSCTQHPGDVIYVPDGLPHAVLNTDGETLALAIQHDAQAATLLHHAAGHGHTQVVPALLAAGADIDHRDALGRTSLYVAVDAGQTDMVRTLLQSGATRGIAERSGQTPLFRAQAHGDRTATSLLVDATLTPHPSSPTHDTRRTGRWYLPTTSTSIVAVRNNAPAAELPSQISFSSCI